MSAQQSLFPALVQHRGGEGLPGPAPGVVYIYALKCPDTGQVRYVGKAKEPKKRLTQHLSEARHKTGTHRRHWLQELLAADKEPVLEILEETSVSEWEQRERYYISLYKATGLLVNDTEGGDGMTTERAKKLWQNPEYRRKQVEAATGEKNGFFGRTHTPETRKILAEKCRHEVPWNAGKTGVYSDEVLANNRLQEHRKQVGRYTKAGELVDTWDSIRDLCRELGWDRRTAQRVLQGAKHFNSINGYKLHYI
jgi:group I intron endonuclease